MRFAPPSVSRLGALATSPVYGGGEPRSGGGGKSHFESGSYESTIPQ